MNTPEEILEKCGVRIFGSQQQRIIQSMKEYASQFYSEEQVIEAAKSTPIGENILNDLLKALKEQSKLQSE